MSRTIAEYKTVPSFLPILIAIVYFIAQFFISPNFYLTIPVSLIALFLTYKWYKNYAVFFEDKLVLFVFGKKLELKYSEIEYVQITRSPRRGSFSPYIIILKVIGKIKPVGYSIQTNDKPILKRLEENGVNIQYLRNTKEEDFYNPY